MPLSLHFISRLKELIIIIIIIIILFVDDKHTNFDFNKVI